MAIPNRLFLLIVERLSGTWARRPTNKDNSWYEKQPRRRAQYLLPSA